MKRHRRLWAAAGCFGGLTLAVLMIVVLSGCSSGHKKDDDHGKDAQMKKDDDDHKDHGKHGGDADIKAERDKLSPQDRKLVDEQDACPIVPDNRLGIMGLPIKVTLMGQTIFVCCKGCVKKAERKPDETLAKVAELRAQNKAPAPK